MQPLFTHEDRDSVSVSLRVGRSCEVEYSGCCQGDCYSVRDKGDCGRVRGVVILFILRSAFVQG
jgi:hypothetical protein